MDFSQINPAIRFAEIIHYQSDGHLSYVRDCRLFYILSGKADILINNQNHTLIPHSIFYCRGGSQYSIISSGVELISLNFDLIQAHNSDDEPYSPVHIIEGCILPPYNHSFIDDIDYLNNHLVLYDCVAYYDQFKAILEEFSTQKIFYKETASGLLKAIFPQLYRHRIESTTQAAKAVLITTAYINANYSKNLTNQLFSEMTGYHEYYLNRLFLKHSGFTIHQYILNVRIIQARKLLLNSHLPLSAIAEKIGFNSNTY